MRLFLDTSVLLAACGSAKGASREIFRLAPRQKWTLVTITYVLDGVGRNLAALPYRASASSGIAAWYFSRARAHDEAAPVNLVAKLAEKTNIKLVARVRDGICPGSANAACSDDDAFR